MHHNDGNEHGLRHGFARIGSVHPLYRVWLSMRQRCTNPRCKAWARYGGRGIKLCAEWGTFEGFYAYAAVGYSPGLTLERVDNDGPYSPGNCRWATRAEQTRNTSHNVRVTVRGRTMILNEWARELGLSRQALYYWKKKGLTYEQAIERALG